MKIDFRSPLRDGKTGEILLHTEFRFTNLEWDTFAPRMKKAIETGNREEVLALMRRAIDASLSNEGSLQDRKLIVPVEQVSPETFEEIKRGKI